MRVDFRHWGSYYRVPWSRVMLFALYWLDGYGSTLFEREVTLPLFVIQ